MGLFNWKMKKQSTNDKKGLISSMNQMRSVLLQLVSRLSLFRDWDIGNKKDKKITCKCDRMEYNVNIR